MIKLKNIFLIIIFLFLGCAQNSSIAPVLKSRWVSKNNSKFQIWFQNWSGYTRLFFSINKDTSVIQPSQYATSVRGKPHLFPQSRSQIEKVQLIGNIMWDQEPTWGTGKENKFIWKVDRSNPKIELPSEYEGSATADDKIMRLIIRKDKEVIYDLTLKSISV